MRNIVDILRCAGEVDEGIWTELTLILRGDAGEWASINGIDQRIDILEVQVDPLVLEIRSGEKALVAATGTFLESHGGGRLGEIAMHP